MTDTNIEHEGECQECARRQNSEELLQELLHKAEDDNKVLHDSFSKAVEQVARLEGENKELLASRDTFVSATQMNADEVKKLGRENMELQEAASNMAQSVQEAYDELTTERSKSIALDQQNKELRDALANHKTLIAALDKYVIVLNDEINSLIPAAHVHGWRSERVQKGIEIRELIDKARKLLEP